MTSDDLTGAMRHPFVRVAFFGSLAAANSVLFLSGFYSRTVFQLALAGGVVWFAYCTVLSAFSFTGGALT